MEFCMGIEGHHHNISSLRTGEVFDPVTKSVIGNFEILCTGCGMSLNAIRESGSKVGTRRRKKKNSPPEPTAAPTSPGGDLQKLD